MHCWVVTSSDDKDLEDTVRYMHIKVLHGRPVWMPQFGN